MLHFRVFNGDPAAWDAVIIGLANAHILQSSVWAAFKRFTGWQPQRYIVQTDSGAIVAAACVLCRKIGPLRVLYIPKGPMLAYDDTAALATLLAGLERAARRQLAIQIKIDPDVPLSTGVPNSPDFALQPLGQAFSQVLEKRGWQKSAEQVQFRNTITIDLTQSEEVLLAAMGSGKRRKVRYGERHGVTVRAANQTDLPLLYKLYAETGQRNGFITRPYDYYIQEWGSLMAAGRAHGLIAEVAGNPVAHVILFHFGQRCLYFTGASVSDAEVRKLMPADMLQWAAIRWAKAQGYHVYDMWGAPTHFDESDPMWGVFQFKQDFGGVVVSHIGAYDYAPYPPLYWAYTKLMPRLLAYLKRRRAGA
jgi:peptidoglycan pentaglycine glycine transferase (the first glycine)